MKVKVFEIVKTGLAPLSEELEETIQKWLDGNENIEILTTSQSQHLRENTIFVTFWYLKITLPAWVRRFWCKLLLSLSPRSRLGRTDWLIL